MRRAIWRHVRGHTDTLTHTHTNKPPTAGVQLVGHTSITSSVNSRTRSGGARHRHSDPLCRPLLVSCRTHSRTHSCVHSPRYILIHAHTHACIHPDTYSLTHPPTEATYPPGRIGISTILFSQSIYFCFEAYFDNIQLRSSDCYIT